MRKTLSRLPRKMVLAGLVAVMMVVIAFAARPTAAPLRSAVLYTPLLFAGAGNGLGCEVVNVSTTTHLISMELFRNDGVSLGQMPATGGPYYSLGPGAAFGGGIAGQPDISIGYCKITVSDGTSSDVRGEVYVNDQTTGQTLAVAPAY